MFHTAELWTNVRTAAKTEDSRRLSFNESILPQLGWGIRLIAGLTQAAKLATGAVIASGKTNCATNTPPVSGCSSPKTIVRYENVATTRIVRGPAGISQAARYLPFFSRIEGQLASAFFRFPSVSVLKSFRTFRLY